jgi:hypothetical protein
MKLRWILTCGLAAVGAICAVLLLRSNNGPQKAVEETRRALRQQGFKTDLTEFNFSTSPELRARAAALTNADLVGGSIRDARRSVLRQETPDLMATVGSNAALVVWRQEKLPARSGAYPWMAENQAREDLWPALREMFNEDHAVLDAACEAALSGPIRFDLDASRGTAMLLPHLARVKSLAQILGTRAILDLHDGNKDAAWTNLLASTRLVTGWDPEPTEVSQMVRYALAALVADAAGGRLGGRPARPAPTRMGIG